MSSSRTPLSLFNFFRPQLKTLNSLVEQRVLKFPATGNSRNPPFLFSKLLKRSVIIMRDRSKNRKPLQRWRNLSIEAIQTVQALKRAAGNGDVSLNRVFESKFHRLIKLDMIAVLRELQRQNEHRLALKVFEDVRKEYWYKPQVTLYADMITILARNGMFEEVDFLLSDMKVEILEACTEEFNALLATLVEFGICGGAVECYHFMEKFGCEPDKFTFRIMINSLESKGELGVSATLRKEAKKYFGESLEFLEEKEETVTGLIHTGSLGQKMGIENTYGNVQYYCSVKSLSKFCKTSVVSKS